MMKCTSVNRSKVVLGLTLVVGIWAYFSLEHSSGYRGGVALLEITQDLATVVGSRTAEAQDDGHASFDGGAEALDGPYGIGGEGDSADHVDHQGVQIRADGADHVEGGGDLGQIGGAFAGEQKPLRQAAEEGDAKGCLKPFHLLADGPGGDTQLASGGLEAEMAGGGLERFEAVEGGKAIGHRRCLSTGRVTGRLRFSMSRVQVLSFADEGADAVQTTCRFNAGAEHDSAV